jgi:hypothetical protein
MRRRIFVERSMRSDRIVVIGVGPQDAAQMLLAEDNDVVETFPANRPNQPFGKPVLPRRPSCDGFVANAHCVNPLQNDRRRRKKVVWDIAVQS